MVQGRQKMAGNRSKLCDAAHISGNITRFSACFFPAFHKLIIQINPKMRLGWISTNILDQFERKRRFWVSGWPTVATTRYVGNRVVRPPREGWGRGPLGGHMLCTWPATFLFCFCFCFVLILLKKKIFFWKFLIYSWPEGLTSWLWGLTKLTIRVNLCFIFGHMNLFDLIKISYEISQRFSFVDI